MHSNQNVPPPIAKMAEMAQALAELRDSWVRMSLVLGDFLAQEESPIRDEILVELERYLCRLSESSR